MMLYKMETSLSSGPVFCAKNSISTTERIKIRCFITFPLPEKQSVKEITYVVYACICTYLSIALFIGLISVP